MKQLFSEILNIVHYFEFRAGIDTVKSNYDKARKLLLIQDGGHTDRVTSLSLTLTYCLDRQSGRPIHSQAVEKLYWKQTDGHDRFYYSQTRLQGYST